MRIVFFGTSEFAIPALQKLVAAGYKIVCVVTQPDKPAGRKQLPLPSPVKVWALEHGLKIFQPESLKTGDWKVEIPEVNIVASYGKIIPKWLIERAKFGSLNIHPSLLPKYRGPSPIQAAILHGDSETGVTIIKLDEKMDHGPMVASSRLEIRNSKSGYKELHDRLAKLGAELLIKTLHDYIAGKIRPFSQDHLKATFTTTIAKDDARINWNTPAEQIERLIRAFSEWPGAWTTLDDKKLLIFRAQVNPKKQAAGTPGKILTDQKNLTVSCQSGSIQILELQLESKNKLPAQEFIKGRRNISGKILI